MKPRLIAKKNTTAIAALWLLSLCYSLNAQRSTSGPVRPSDVSIGIIKEKSELQKAPVVIIDNVPYYLWHHGCGPTALGMVIGYYDLAGFPDLVEGYATTQTTGVNSAIANDLHYNDYSLPLDEEPNLLKDKSELGGAHASNCLGDFLQTSWSSRGSYYGWGYNSDMLPAFSSYFNMIYPGNAVTATRIYYSNPDIWNIYKNEINNNRPVVFLVDSNGDGETDHFVTGTGYDDSENLYAIHDTWDNETHWYSWRGMASGSSWGIYCMNIFNVQQPIEMPNVSTFNVNTVTQFSAVCGGNIEFDGGADITARGVCWNTSPDPTINLFTKTNDGSGTGSYISNLTGLTPGTVYYVRAYATNSLGTSYGLQHSFRTYNPDAVQDIDGNYYNLITIGSQIWLGENLRTTHLNNNIQIPEITSESEWISMNAPAMCYYDNDVDYKNIYGTLYNQYTVNTGSLCPIGWHVPTDIEWKALTDFLGGESIAGGKLKEAGLSYWGDPNVGATNESGFTALPGGTRYVNDGGTFYGVHSNAVFWTSTLNITRSIFNSSSDVFRGEFGYPFYGFSVRCIKDVPVLTTSAVSELTPVSALSGGDITYDGGSPIILRGVCWSTNPGPTVDLPTRTVDGEGIGVFTSSLTDLSAGTTYYVRAYATNSFGTSYGNEITFRTYNPDAIQDPEGNYYNIITLGDQTWMAENLRYLPAVSSLNEGSLTEPHYYVYDYWGTNVADAKASENYNTYGVLYNWPASVNVCPDGWRLPSDEDWKSLEIYLGMTLSEADQIGLRGTNEGSKLAGNNSLWLDGALDSNGSFGTSGFNALPGGYRSNTGSNLLHSYSIWWTSTACGDNTPWWRLIDYSLTGIIRDAYAFSSDHGFSVRCVKENTTGQSIPLTSGWNILSMAVTPSDLSMLAIVDPLITSEVLMKVQNETGRALERLLRDRSLDK